MLSLLVPSPEVRASLFKSFVSLCGIALLAYCVILFQQALETRNELGATKVLLDAERAHNELLARSVAAAESALQTREALKTKTTRTYTVKSTEVAHALKENKDLAAQPVPDVVWDRLFNSPQEGRTGPATTVPASSVLPHP